MPPDDSTGSAMNAAGPPVLWRSTRSNASSSSVRQSRSPVAVVNRGRYAFGANTAIEPTGAGPWPRRPAEYVAAAAPPVMPCQLWANPTTSQPPVTTLASRRAASLDSAPVVSSSTLVSPGASVPSASARSITGRDSIPENRWSSRPIISVTTSTISGWECPRMALI